MPIKSLVVVLPILLLVGCKEGELNHDSPAQRAIDHVYRVLDVSPAFAESARDQLRSPLRYLTARDKDLYRKFLSEYLASLDSSRNAREVISELRDVTEAELSLIKESREFPEDISQVLIAAQKSFLRSIQAARRAEESLFELSERNRIELPEELQPTLSGVTDERMESMSFGMVTSILKSN